VLYFLCKTPEIWGMVGIMGISSLLPKVVLEFAELLGFLM